MSLRWFWLFILAMCVVTGGLYTSRVRTKRAPAVIEPTPVPASSRRSARTTEPKPRNEVQREEREVVEVPSREPEPERIQEPTDGVADELIVAEPVAETPVEIPAETLVETPVVESVEPMVEEFSREIEAVVSEPEPEPEPVLVPEPEPVLEPEPESAPAPSYELLPDGTLRILATQTVIVGSGTMADPFVLDWVTLRALERVFNPKKGKDELPDWLDLIDEQYVRIKGNTLVPVIATTTRELLVMQNPWDGCCIGIPPSPYDAIEVLLNHEVDFGSSAVGYGVVEGVFILDPYVVDGWVLGLYMIEDATYRSGEGVPFPDF